MAWLKTEELPPTKWRHLRFQSKASDCLVNGPTRTARRTTSQTTGAPGIPAEPQPVDMSQDRPAISHCGDREGVLPARSEPD
jgi:hypothetical protein